MSEATTISKVNENSDRNLETFSVIWLDSNGKIAGSTEQNVRSIINHLTKFQDVELCKRYIDQTSTNDRLILIADNRFDKELASYVAKYRQIISVYVYSNEKKENEQCSSIFSNV